MSNIFIIFILTMGNVQEEH